MNTKKLLFIIPLAITSLVSCGGGGEPSNETIKLYDANSRLIGTPKPDPLNPSQTLPMLEENILTGKLPTYHHKDKGDVPYVSVKDLASAVGSALQLVITPGMTTENKSDGFHLYSQNKKGEFVIDADKDIIKLKNGQYFGAPILNENNGIAGDYINFRGNSIKESDKTKVYKEDGSAAPEYDTFDFGKYNFDIVTKDNECYVPIEAFSKVLFRDISIDLAYNGSEYFSNISNSSFLGSLIYSSEGYFHGASGIYSPSKSKASGEAYRFESPTQKLKEGSETEYEDYTRFLVLGEDGAGYSMLCKGKELDPSKAVEDVEASYSYLWTKKGDILKVSVSDNGKGLGDYQIHLNKTNVFSNSVSKEVSEYNYNTLRFMFDTIYGLKDIKGYKDATAFFKEAGVDDGLKSNKINEYNAAFGKLLGYIDDGHTAYSNLSHYSGMDELDNFDTYKKTSMSGPRISGLGSKYKTYIAGRMAMAKKLNPDDLNPNDPTYYQGIKFSNDKQTAIIAFDAFQHNFDEIKNMKELFPDDYSIDENNYNIQTRAKLINSSPDGFSQAFKILDIINKTDKVVKNVVIDLTTNGGGAIATMAYLSAFFSDDPHFVMKDINNGVIREYHYKVDLNGDGVYGGAGDTYKDKFNFYVLTSGFSFSCGNCLPGMAKDAGAKIIGETSGGGTSPVGVYFDALGSFFNLSNHYDMLYKVNGKYVQNDSGITLDYAYPYADGNWYDPNAVDTFIKSL